jgi:hypothetical protein
MAVDIDARDRFLSITVKKTDSAFTVYKGSFEHFLTIAPEEVHVHCNLGSESYITPDQ